MEVLQVKQYNSTIAEKKWQNCDKTKSVPSMFFFYKENEYNLRYGYNIRRKNGYIAFDNIKAVFGINRDKAIARFNRA